MRLPSPLRGRIAALLLVLALVGLGPAGWSMARAAVPSGQGGQEEIASIGLPRLGEVVFEIVGRTDRGGDVVTFTGYLTALAGADPTLLFTEAERQTEQTARFTVSAELTPVATGQVEPVSVLAAVGSLSIHFLADGGADFADPASFAGGEAIAVYEARTKEIVTDRSDGTTLITTGGELLQIEAPTFAHEGTTYRLGRSKALLQVRLTGAAIESGTVAAGRAELATIAGAGGQDAPDEATPEDVETPTAVAGDGCDLIEPWFEATSTQADDIQVLVEFILDVESVEELDAGQLRVAADALGVLAGQGRAATLPDEAAAVAEAVADATEAIGEAVSAAADAVEAGDEEDFAAVQQDLADALDVFLDAVADAETLAEECAEE